MRKWINAIAAISVGLTAVACDSNEPEPLPATRVENVPADPTTGHDPTTGAPIGETGRYTFYDLSSNQIILDRENDDRTDSVSTGWDLAFQSSNIIVNSPATGGGQGGVQVLNVDFDALTEAPQSGYVTSSVGLMGSSDLAWGKYEPALNLVFTLDGKTLVVRTADGKFAKVRIINYYKNDPEVPDAFVDEARWFTFEFVYQPDGSRNLADG